MFKLNALRNTGLAATLIAASLAEPFMVAAQSQNQGSSSTQSQPPQGAPMGGHGPMMGQGMMGPGMMGGGCMMGRGMMGSGMMGGYGMGSGMMGG